MAFSVGNRNLSMVKKLREKLDQLRKTIWKSSGKKKESKKGEEAQKVENRKEVDTGKEGAQSEITHSFFFHSPPRLNSTQFLITRIFLTFHTSWRPTVLSITISKSTNTKDSGKALRVQKSQFHRGESSNSKIPEASTCEHTKFQTVHLRVWLSI